MINLRSVSRPDSGEKTGNSTAQTESEAEFRRPTTTLSLGNIGESLEGELDDESGDIDVEFSETRGGITRYGVDDREQKDLGVPSGGALTQQ